jgi:HAD superfamily phosphoserine phosphatase-like hydrolase
MPISDVLFDFDSTLVDLETLDELLRLSLEEQTGTRGCAAVLARIRAITEDGMNGRMDLAESLTLRLRAAALRREHVDSFRAGIRSHLTPGMPEVFDRLRRRGIRTWILSGGIAECIEPVADLLQVPYDRLIANRFLYDEQGNVTDVDRGNPLASSGGKTDAIRRLRAEGRIGGSICVVGDGMTDAHTYLSGAAERFIGFGMHRGSAEVRKAAPAYCTGTEEISRLLEA